ncbi:MULTISPECIES: hypothetical protein [unclassified Streptomyces]|nr:MULTISPECIES: hypothetical protein [unclassified Streptomyces]WSR22025.1 hypothetical protein OG573_24730 [Streptomyces sp. NBC_01205]
MRWDNLTDGPAAPDMTGALFGSGSVVGPSVQTKDPQGPDFTTLQSL